MRISELEIAGEVKKLEESGYERKEALCVAWSKAYNEPQKSLKLIGVTGTNGKTTVASLICHILNGAGKKCACMGTMDNSGYTTAPPDILFEQLSAHKENGCEYVVMEVSSHGLAQSRECVLNYEIAVFTNLSRDHLDYHGTMKAYAKAKQKLFYRSRVGIINKDSPYSEYFKGICNKTLMCSLSGGGDFQADNVRLSENGVSYILTSMGKTYNVYFPVVGRFSVYNSLCAIAAANSAGVEINKAIKLLQSFKGVQGRAQKLPLNEEFDVYIDYAHTPEGLSALLNSLWPLCKGRLTVVFGCGGLRDTGKRPLMLRAAARSADFIVVTSDNPRTEPPYEIIKDILKGLDNINTPFAVIENRKKAIEFAISLANKGDIIVLAGKGHENSQITAAGKMPFNETEIVKNAVRLCRTINKGDSV